MTDEQYMRLALDLAEKARGKTSPNPLVGAVIVKDGVIIGRGYHEKAGMSHAEINALADAGDNARGATIYVTLEPCVHTGRTGPCTDALIAAGIKKVVAAMTDPNPRVVGQGFARLRAAGIEVVEGVLADEALKLNDIFIKWITTGKPFVTLKTAMTVDGKIAAYTGHSRWVTGEESRHTVHRLRGQYDAIMVGIGTVLADNPALTTRLLDENGEAVSKNPIRVIVDSLARTPLDSQVVSDGLAPTIIAVTPEAPRQRVEALRQKGVEVAIISSDNARVNMAELLNYLGSDAKMITSILVEGGASINASLVTAGLADKLYCFIAPKIIGGHAAPGLEPGAAAHAGRPPGAGPVLRHAARHGQSAL